MRCAWPTDRFNILCRVDDSTWWIANKTIATTMKYKEPTSQQLVGSQKQPEPAPARPVNLAYAAMESGKSPYLPPVAAALPPDEKRVSAAALWAHSVSQTPALAEAALLAVLVKLYREPEMKQALRTKASLLMAAPRFKPENLSAADQKDVDAIRRMLA